MRPALLIIALVALPAAALAQEGCRAIDGDTIRCGSERIRLKGIYTAEIGEPGGLVARERLQRKLESGDVRVVRNGRDKYGRPLADVYVGGERITQGDVGRVGGRGTRTR